MVPFLLHRSLIRLCASSALSAGVWLTPTGARAAGLVGTPLDPDRCTAGVRVAAR